MNWFNTAPQNCTENRWLGYNKQKQDSLKTGWYGFQAAFSCRI
jgi:hypothetical protein